ncbi:MAG: PLP-dependent aminotransferase family protein, partial [Gammaproteobacteria bacterium]
IGQPDPALLPAHLFQGMSADASSLAYGAEPGDSRFRESLAEWLGREYEIPVDAEALLVTNGSSNALDMICTRYTRPGDVVLVEDPTYFIARRQFTDHGLKTVAVPMDKDGVDIQSLEKLIKRHKPVFFYTVPTFHNPTGCTLSRERRSLLIALCKRMDCLIVADEVYQQLYYDVRPPLPLACLDAEAPVLSIGSFSKILAPGLRLGWLQGGRKLLQQIEKSALLASGGGLAPLTSALVRPLIDNGDLDKHLDYLKTTYSKRLAVLVENLRIKMGDRIDFIPPTGGFFVWVTWKDKTDTGALLPVAIKSGVDFLPGRQFSESPGQAHAMRLCFAFYDEHQLQQACTRLARLSG